MAKNKTYSFWFDVWKAIKYGILFGVPALINHWATLYPDSYNLPVGALVTLIFLVIKKKGLGML